MCGHKGGQAEQANQCERECDEGEPCKRHVHVLEDVVDIIENFVEKTTLHRIFRDYTDPDIFDLLDRIHDVAALDTYRTDSKRVGIVGEHPRLFLVEKTDDVLCRYDAHDDEFRIGAVITQEIEALVDRVICGSNLQCVKRELVDQDIQ